MGNDNLLIHAMTCAGYHLGKSRNRGFLRFIRNLKDIQKVADLRFEWRGDAYRIIGAIGVNSLGDVHGSFLTDTLIPLENYPHVTDVSIMEKVDVEMVKLFVEKLVHVIEFELPNSLDNFSRLLYHGGGKFGEYVRIVVRMKG